MHVDNRESTSTCGEYYIWDYNCIPTKVNNHLLISVIDQTTNLVNKQQYSCNSFSPQFSPIEFTKDILSSICQTKPHRNKHQSQQQSQQQGIIDVEYRPG